MLNLEPGEEPPESPPKHQAELKTSSNGVLHAPTDYLPPFYQPPAPPPSQPLPEKPDSMAASTSDSFVPAGLKRTETEKPFLTPAPSTKSDSGDSQILSLVEALKSAKQEISTQGDRMKYLEGALRRERKLRETAERRARAFAGKNDSDFNDTTDEMNDTFEPPLDSIELIEQDLPNGHIDNFDVDRTHLSTSASMETLKDASEDPSEILSDTNAASVKSRYDLLKLEFEQMKLTMETYKRKAEEAESSQRRFAELVESIRAGRSTNSTAHTSISFAPSAPGSVTSNDSTLIGSDASAMDDTANFSKDPSLNHQGENFGLWSPPRKHNGLQKNMHLANGGPVKGGELPAALEQSLTRVLEAQKLIDGQQGVPNGKWRESTPYVSMVGVVLIGVGIMTWLNGWPAPGGGGKVME